MRRCIASVCLSGTLEDKLKAIAAAGFDGVEIFDNDLVNSGASPRQIRALATDLGLRIELFQPFRDLEGMPDDVFRRTLERAERKLEVMAELGAPLLLVCSNVSSQALPDVERAAAQLHTLAERASQRGLRIAYEALAWGTHVRTYGQAWHLIQRAAHPALGLCIDSFHTLALGGDPAGIASIPGDRIFFVQLADAPRLQLDPLSWSRHFRCFPGQGELDVAGLLEQVLRSGYRGPLSLEVFNDVFRGSDTRQTALDALRSLRYLEEQVAAAPAAPPTWRGTGFLEFAVDDDTEHALAAWLEQLGFHRAGRHRSKAVTLYRQGRVNLILNAEPDSFAHNYFHLHGPSLCAMALRTDDAAQALERARAMLASPIEGRVGPNERSIPAIRSVDGSLLYVIDGDEDAAEPFATDFVLEAAPADTPVGLLRVDHLAMALPPEALDAWVLFARAVLGLIPQPIIELAEPYGIMRSRAVVDRDRCVRITLNASEGRNSMMMRSLSTFAGPGVHHIAVSCSDIFATVQRLKARGVAFLAAPANYYDDLAARFDLADDLITHLRNEGVLYDRSANAEFLHVLTEAFDGRFAFEIVQRSPGYDGHGEANAPTELAAQARRLLVSAS